ncbi:Small nuclear ribonucleoprotein family protein [Hibiscus syriacus]|uniref:Small nuclear ribonucleoprotein family protein n=1 Tax=Hibiscus syriacus TaxID=106335 RepID=A0A6A2YYU7_HIBSY|nr:Small nuclear ribonucleoprotein family protein [Hibiscus syriacus]
MERPNHLPLSSKKLVRELLSRFQAFLKCSFFENLIHTPLHHSLHNPVVVHRFAAVPVTVNRLRPSLAGIRKGRKIQHSNPLFTPSMEMLPPVQAPPPSTVAPSHPPGPSHHDEVRTIFITGLPEDVKERELQNLLRWLPGFEASQVNYKGENPMGFAFFSNAQFAVAAKDAVQEMVFDAKSKSLLHIEIAKKNLFVKRGIAIDSDAYDLYGCYLVPPVPMPMPNPTPVLAPSIYVPVQARYCNDKSGAVAKSGRISFNNWWKEGVPKIRNGFRISCYTLYVENLPEKIHWKMFGSLFCIHGQIIDAFIPNKRNTKRVHFGFIRFATIEEARKAILKMNGSHIDGNKIGVSLAKYNPRRLIGESLRQLSTENNLVVGSRRVWLVCEEIPFHAWNWGTFKNIAARWGNLLAIDESSQFPSSFDRAKIQILIKAQVRIDESLDLKVDANFFKILVHEIEPSFKLKSWVLEESDDSLELYSFGASLDNSQSGTPVFYSGSKCSDEDVAIEATRLEKDSLRKSAKDSGIHSTKALDHLDLNIVEHHVHKSVDPSDGVSPRASEDVLMMGLFPSNGLSNDAIQLRENSSAVPPLLGKLRRNRVVKKCKINKGVYN